MIKDQQWYEDVFWNWMPTEFNFSDFWMEKSENYIPTAPIVRDIPYGSGNSDVLDIFVPGQKIQNAPVLIFIHGGFWQWLDKDH